MRLLASGRDAAIYDLGGGRVLRRCHRPRSMEREARTMTYARQHGYPAPAVHAVSGVDMVMDRVDGTTMLEDIIRDPSGVAEHARTLAALHARLHAIPGPPWLRAPFGEPTALLHFDLHPGNVILAKDGPVVIDWPDALAGPAAADVAQTWLLIGAGEPPPMPEDMIASIPLVRSAFLEEFLSLGGRPQAAALLPAVAAEKLGDPNLRNGEREAIGQLVAAESGGRLAV